MEDSDFMRKVERHQITFGRGDILKVLLQQNTQRTPNGLKTSYTVVEIPGMSKKRTGAIKRG